MAPLPPWCVNTPLAVCWQIRPVDALERSPRVLLPLIDRVGRRDPRTTGKAFARQDALQRREQEQDVVRSRVNAHDTDPPHLSLQGAEPASDLDPEFAEEPAAYFRI